MSLVNLDPNGSDRLATVVRSLSGAIPYLGDMVSEFCTSLIPNQRVERLTDYLKVLGEKLKDLNADLQRLSLNSGNPLRVGIFEDGFLQAALAATAERREQIASIIATGLTVDDFNYERVKKILNTLNDLTDSEIIVLRRFALRGDEYRNFSQEHWAILRPVDESIGASPSDVEHAALRSVWELNLQRLGLIATPPRGKGFHLTSFGSIMLKYLFP